MVHSRNRNSTVGRVAHGFTLIELLAVVAILATIALIAVSRIGSLGEHARIVTAERELLELKDAFVNSETGYLHDLQGLPGFSPGSLRLANLLISTNLYGSVETAGGGRRACRLDEVWQAGAARPTEFTAWNETRQRGWRGPYLRHPVAAFPARDDVRFADDAPFRDRGFFPRLTDPRLPGEFLSARDGCSIYGFPGEDTVLDPWGNPYVLQIPPSYAFSGAASNITAEVRFHYARVVSAGPDGRLETPCHESPGGGERARRLVRQAGLIDRSDRSARGDDLVLFLFRNDIDEGEER